MRLDYPLYVVAIILFAITAISSIVLVEFERNLSVVTTVVLGLLFLALGYTQRPHLTASAFKAPAPPAAPIATQAPPVVEAPKKEEPVVEITPPRITELTTVKGIKAKRAEQLKALGINSAEDLAKASPQELSEKLKIAQYFTERWVASAKETVEKS
jgi:predicted flap endonuclease-1-like 5' DNA nuclease